MRPIQFLNRLGRHIPLLLLSLAATLPALADPTITDKAMAQKLLGRHQLTLQWLGSGSLKDAGKVEVKAENGTWHLTGRQDAKEGYVSLDGVVTAVDATTFAFTGKIITNVSYINQGKDCLRDGNFTFAKKGTRKYWRMQQIDNPCDEAADYVDIYLR